MTGAEVKDYINRKVIFQGTEYYLSAYILRKRQGKFYYQAELKDLKKNAVYIVNLEKVEVI